MNLRTALIFLFAATVMPVATAGLIADFPSEYQAGAFPTGWQYLRNTGTIGDSSNYTPLLWNAGFNRYAVSSTLFPAADGDYLSVSSTTVHPGLGTTQGVPNDRYLIFAYTVQAGEAGNVTLSGSIRGTDAGGMNGASNGWDLRVFIGNAESGSADLLPWSNVAANFGRSLGAANIGDIIYVALGSSGSHFFDTASFQFQLDSEVAHTPEPSTFALVGVAGAAALLFRRRRRQHE